MGRVMLSQEESKKALALLRSISTKGHARTIARRNTELLDKGITRVPCPHCECFLGTYDCFECLWSLAIFLVTRSNPAKDGHSLPPCLRVSFGPGTSSAGINMWSDSARVTRRSPRNTKFLQEHVRWARSRGWGSDKKRIEDAKRQIFRTEPSEESLT